MKRILIISVLITSSGVRRYRTGGAFNSANPLARVSRFLTATSTLSQLEFDEICVNYELAEEFEHLYSTIDDFLNDLFQSPKISHSRFRTGSEWAMSLRQFPEEAIVVLHSNDDHAFVGDPRIFAELVELMGSKSYDYICTTHFAEWLGIALRCGSPRFEPLGAPYQSRELIGTGLARAGFLAELFQLYEDRFPNQFIPRPDNPFGPDLSEVLAPGETFQTFAPAFELFRHLDGYSHILAKRPLVPLKDTYDIRRDEDNCFKIQELKAWRSDLWPRFQISPCSSIYPTPSENDQSLSRIKRFRILVGYLIGYYSVAILPIRPNNLAISRSGLRRVEVLAAKFCACLNPSVARNFPDLLLRLTFRVIHLEEPKAVARVGWIRSLWTGKRQTLQNLLNLQNFCSKARR